MLGWTEMSLDPYLAWDTEEAEYIYQSERQNISNYCNKSLEHCEKMLIVFISHNDIDLLKLYINPIPQGIDENLLMYATEKCISDNLWLPLLDLIIKAYISKENNKLSESDMIWFMSKHIKNNIELVNKLLEYDIKLV